MAHAVATAFTTRVLNAVKALVSTSTTRYKMTFHVGATRPTAATAAYAATGLGELATTTNYTTGGAGLSGGVQLNATLTGAVLSLADKVITTAAGETIGPVDTIAVWDTSDGNSLVGVLDYVAAPHTASNGGTFTVDFPASFLTLSATPSVV